MVSLNIVLAVGTFYIMAINIARDYGVLTGTIVGGILGTMAARTLTPLVLGPRIDDTRSQMMLLMMVSIGAIVGTYIALTRG